MPYSEQLAIRVRERLSRRRNVEEKRMMGGLTFMVNGKMCVGILGEDLMCRIDPEVYETALRRKGCREMNFTGRPMKGFVFVSPEGTHRTRDLDSWVGLALQFNRKARSTTKRIRKPRR
jgi:TfoX/Sxy family transcriptional regulator of competence genes